QGWHVLAQHILRVGQVAHADDDDLTQPAGKSRLPSYGVGMIEPALGERRRVEQHAVDVDQLAAPPGTKSCDHLRQFGCSRSWIKDTRAMESFSSRLGDRYSILKPVALMIGVQRTNSSAMNCRVASGASRGLARSRR